MKKNKILIIVLVLIIFSGAVATTFYLQFKKSPKYSLMMIAKSSKTHDYQLFKKHFDIEGVANEMVEDVMTFATADIEEPENELERLGQEMAKGFFGLIKPKLAESIQDQIQDYIETGNFEESDDKAIALTQLLGIDDKQNGSESGNALKGIKYIKKDGKVASVGLEMKAQDGEDIVVELKMRDLGSYWQVAEISNMNELITTLNLKLDSLQPSGQASGFGGNNSLRNAAIFGTAKANVDIIRSLLASYAADSDSNKYPVGKFSYDAIKELLPQDYLPQTSKEAKWAENSFLYTSRDGNSFTITVKVDYEYQDVITGTPSGIAPASYPR